MKTHLLHILQQWEPDKNNFNWVFGVIYKTQGSCYRKAGAMMLFGSLGQQYGMLSGGCLESDVQLQAKKVMQSGETAFLKYDDNDLDDSAFSLGVGCGGTVYIALIPLSTQNEFLKLPEMREKLEQGQSLIWCQTIAESADLLKTKVKLSPIAALKHSSSLYETEDQIIELEVTISPPPHLLIAGGGFDAIPLAESAANLGWQVSIWDPRPAYAKQRYFPAVECILRDEEVLTQFAAEREINAAVLMTHSKKLDATALATLYPLPLNYIAILGPEHRKAEVIELSGVEENTNRLKIAGPAGLNIGAELPESIALAILAECHAALSKADAKSLSGMF